MLKINLLPPYIYEGAKRRNVTVLWVAILLLVVGGCVLAKVQLDSKAADLKKQTEDLRPDADKADKLEADAKDIETKSAEIRGKADFVTKAHNHNAEVYPSLFQNIATYTHRGTLYDSVTPQGNTVAISAYARSLWDVGLYMIWMENNPKISNVAIAMNSIPSFPVAAGQQVAAGQGAGVRPPGGGGHDFNATLTLLEPVPAGPAYSPGGAPTGGGGGGGGGPMGGMMMGPMMGPGGPMSGGPMGGGSMSSGPMGSGMGGRAGGARKGGAED